MLYNPFRGLRRREWALFLVSLATVLVPGLLVKTDPLILCATAIGVTSLIFIARGDAWGQLLMVVFSLLYAVAAWPKHYYGEIITYLFMSAPISAASVVTWLKNPYEGEGRESCHQVKIYRLRPMALLLLTLVTAAVTLTFYFVLKALGNEDLAVSTLSVATSFFAASLMLLRSPYYALAYGLNDVVLVVLWLLASVKDPASLPMAINFLVFLANDLYGFVSWRKREKRQSP